MFIPIWIIKVILVALLSTLTIIVAKFINEFTQKRRERKKEKETLLEDYTQAALEGKVLTSGILNHWHARQAVDDKDLGTFALPRKTDAEYALIDGHVFKITFLAQKWITDPWLISAPKKVYTYLIRKETL